MKIDVQAFLKPGETILNQEILPLSRTTAIIVGNTENRYYMITKKRQKTKFFMSLKSFEAITLRPFPWVALIALGIILLGVGIGLAIGLPEVLEAYIPVLVIGGVFLLLGAIFSGKMLLGMRTSNIPHRPGYIISKRYTDNVINFIQIVHGFAKLTG